MLQVHLWPFGGKGTEAKKRRVNYGRGMKRTWKKKMKDMKKGTEDKEQELEKMKTEILQDEKNTGNYKRRGRIKKEEIRKAEKKKKNRNKNKRKKRQEREKEEGKRGRRNSRSSTPLQYSLSKAAKLHQPRRLRSARRMTLLGFREDDAGS